MTKVYFQRGVIESVGRCSRMPLTLTFSLKGRGDFQTGCDLKEYIEAK